MFALIDAAWMEPFATPLGLPSSDTLRDLGPLVVLAGPNGSGKSRFLQAFKNLLQQANDLESLAANGTTSQDVEHELSAPRPDGLSDLPRRRQLAALRFREAQASGSSYEFCDLTQPRSPTVHDAASTGAGDHGRCVKGCEVLGLSGPYEYQHVFLDAMARRLELSKRSDAEQHRPMIDYANGFNSLLSSFLGTQVVPVFNDAFSYDAMLFDRAFDPKELSDGQKVLIAWAVALHAQPGLGAATVFIDEPENHLHPDACLRALATLRERAVSAGGQIWIATHSVPIIAWAGADCLYAVDKGVVSFAGNKVQGVIDTLSGGSERREELRGFLSEADRFGFYHFVAQCLTRPRVVPHARDNDPQVSAFAQLVASATPDHGRCRVLDFGSGRGRLAEAIARGGSDLSNLDYYLYDVDREFKNDREAAAGRLKALGATASVLDELGSLRVVGCGVHLVVLCNVLHEIPPDEWVRVFEAIQAVLLPTGRLVLIEDQEPAVGELPHNKGFLLLNNNEVAQLFGGPQHVDDRSPNGQGGGRISVVCVERQHVAKANRDTVNGALKDLAVRATQEVQRLRQSSNHEQREGRLHALYTILAYNAREASR